MNYRIINDAGTIDIRKTEAAVDRIEVFPSLAIARAELELQVRKEIADISATLKKALKAKDSELAVEASDRASGSSR